MTRITDERLKELRDALARAIVLHEDSSRRAIASALDELIERRAAPDKMEALRRAVAEVIGADQETSGHTQEDAAGH